MKNLENFSKEESISKCIVGGELIRSITNDTGNGSPGYDMYDTDTGQMHY